jgi:hypothetical protein
MRRKMRAAAARPAIEQLERNAIAASESMSARWTKRAQSHPASSPAACR